MIGARTMPDSRIADSPRGARTIDHQRKKAFSEKGTTMKIIGAVILILGLLLTYYTAITDVSQKEFVAPKEGPVLSMLEPPARGWSSYIGVGVTVVGCLFLYRGEERT